MTGKIYFIHYICLFVCSLWLVDFFFYIRVVQSPREHFILLILIYGLICRFWEKRLLWPLLKRRFILSSLLLISRYQMYHGNSVWISHSIFKYRRTISIKLSRRSWHFGAALRTIINVVVIARSTSNFKCNRLGWLLLDWVNLWISRSCTKVILTVTSRFIQDSI